MGDAGVTEGVNEVAEHTGREKYGDGGDAEMDGQGPHEGVWKWGVKVSRDNVGYWDVKNAVILLWRWMEEYVAWGRNMEVDGI